jgi:hypothetical protein
MSRSFKGKDLETAPAADLVIAGNSFVRAFIGSLREEVFERHLTQIGFASVIVDHVFDQLDG